MDASKHDPKKIWGLALCALGVVYGDIGTSPLYAIRECFEHSHGLLALNHENVLGVLSLIFWALIIVVTIKYLLFVMRADNNGEGGILALMALVAPRGSHSTNRRWGFVVPIGLLGAALLYGDGIITPAISVLSAVEGLNVATPLFSPYVVPLTVVILTILFFFQHHGTGKIGNIFGPIMIVWFFVLGALGLRAILAHPEVLAAVNPIHAALFMINNHWIGFWVLGSVFLVVTGGEALYADMGHFGRAPIRLAWFTLVLPGLILNYFGQGALLLVNPEAIKNPFFNLAPDWALYPMVLLSTVATVIASQALISGVFSLTRQAVQLGFMPRVQIIHTSSSEIGQIYIPFLNWLMFLGTVWLVFSFRSSSNLAAAYGLAVTTTMVATTILAYFVTRRIWRWPRSIALLVTIPFLIVDLGFFLANVVKIPDGGWFPLLAGGIMYTMMSTWQQGRELLMKYMRAKAVPVQKFIANLRLNPPARVPGVALFMTGDPEGTPAALLHNLKHNRVMHERVVILTILSTDVPVTRRSEKVEVSGLDKDIHRVVARYGFLETPNIYEIIALCKEKDLDLPVNEITFFVGKETILASGKPGMALWRERLFVLMARNALRATAFFQIPPDQVIEVGIQVEI